MANTEGKGKQQQQQGKKKDAAVGGDDDEAGSDAEGEDKAADEPKKKEKGKDKKKDDKRGKEDKEGKDMPVPPPLFPATPFYGHPYPGTANFMPVLDGPGWNIEQSLMSARRADEAYIGQWMAEKGAPYQLGAVKWLDDRDKKRREQVGAGGAAYPFPTAGAGKNVAFAAPSDSGRPLFQSQPRYGTIALTRPIANSRAAISASHHQATLDRQVLSWSTKMATASKPRTEDKSLS